MRILDCFSWNKISDITSNIDEIKKNFAFYVDLEMETISHITKDALSKKI